MLKQLIRVQWSRVRTPVILVALILFALPLLMIRANGGPDSSAVDTVGWWLHSAQVIGHAIPILALVAGLYLGIAAWTDDAKGGHVYALTLPLPRERYVVYRFLAGAVPITVPALCLLAGCLIATASVRLPSGVHAYPIALASRAFLATVVCYSIFFAIAIATRRAVLIVMGLLVTLIAAELIAGMLHLDFDALASAATLLTTWPGPLAILAGHWALFDV
jgi:hypothetical protein